MRKIKQIGANGFYIFHGEVAANSNFIETLDEAKQFLIYANFFLKDYLTVYEYVITRHEWHMIVKLNSKEDLLACDTSGEGGEFEDDMVWRIVSERMRLFLSNYVRCVNRMRGRSGTLVHSSYQRYYFETLTEAKTVIDSIRKQSFRFYRRKRKYRGLKKHYKIPRKLGRGSIFLCSRELKKEDKVGRNFLENQYLNGLEDLVLSNLINLTLKSHSPPNPAHALPKIE